MNDSLKKFQCPSCGEEHSILENRCMISGEEISAAYKLRGRTVGGKYEVGEIIGQGGMGIVYEGKHREIGKKVAIKFLFTELTKSKDVLSRFQNEAKIAASVSHKNIVGIFDVGTTPDRIPYIIMEYLEGHSLSDLMKLGTLSEAMAIEITIEVLSGLNAVHSKGIIHRDLKPDNTYIVEQAGGEQIVKIFDFGVSHLHQPMEGKALLTTKTGLVLGTPKYMSPEQAKGSADIDLRVDLYAAGVMLYQMVTGRLPFEADNFNSLIIAIMSEEPVPPRFYRPDLSDTFEGIILKALEKDPGKRYQNASEFAAHLMLIRGYGDDEMPSVVAQIPLDVLKQMREALSSQPRKRDSISSIEVLASAITRRRYTPKQGTSVPESMKSQPALSSDLPRRTGHPYPLLSINHKIKTPTPVTSSPPQQDPFALPLSRDSDGIAMDKTLPGAASYDSVQFLFHSQSASYPAASPQQKKKAWMIPLLMLVVVAVAAAAIIIVSQKRGTKNVAAHPDEVRNPAAGTNQSGTRQDDAKKWKVFLEDLPDDVSIYIDGVLYRRSSIFLKDQDAKRSIVVKAPGYRTWEKSLAVHSDTTIIVNMVPLDRESGGPAEDEKEGTTKKKELQKTKKKQPTKEREDEAPVEKKE